MECMVKLAGISEKEIVGKLLQSYLTELSHFPDENPDYKDENGISQYTYFDAYWEENSRFPYLLFSDGKLAGFALVRIDGGCCEMAEFYVLPEYRRLGLGTSCATDIFRKHHGKWRMSFNKQNQTSQQLWRKLARKLATGDIKKGQIDSSHDYIRFSV